MTWWLYVRILYMQRYKLVNKYGKSCMEIKYAVERKVVNWCLRCECCPGNSLVITWVNAVRRMGVRKVDSWLKMRILAEELINDWMCERCTHDAFASNEIVPTVWILFARWTGACMWKNFSYDELITICENVVHTIGWWIMSRWSYTLAMVYWYCENAALTTQMWVVG